MLLAATIRSGTFSGCCAWHMHLNVHMHIGGSASVAKNPRQMSLVSRSQSLRVSNVMRNFVSGPLYVVGPPPRSDADGKVVMASYKEMKREYLIEGCVTAQHVR